VSETERRSFADSLLRNICAGRNIIWNYKEPRGHSGVILLGIDVDIYDIDAIDEGDFNVKFYLCNKVDYFKWALVAIYGPAQVDLKEQFLTEMVPRTTSYTH
jgi:hypothetical protein